MTRLKAYVVHCTKQTKCERSCRRLLTKTAELETLQQTSCEEIRSLRATITKAEQKSTRFWKLQCKQMLTHEETVEAKDAEITSLREQLVAAQACYITTTTTHREVEDVDNDVSALLESPRVPLRSHDAGSAGQHYLLIHSLGKVLMYSAGEHGC